MSGQAALITVGERLQAEQTHGQLDVYDVLELVAAEAVAACEAEARTAALWPDAGRCAGCGCVRVVITRAGIVCALCGGTS